MRIGCLMQQYYYVYCLYPCLLDNKNEKLDRHLGGIVVETPIKFSEWPNNNSLQWRHNGCDSVLKHQPDDCLLNRLFGHRSKKASKLRVTGLCEGNSPETGEFPAQRASNVENVSIWWRHHVTQNSRLRGFTTSYDKAFYLILKRPSTLPARKYSVFWSPFGANNATRQGARRRLTEDLRAYNVSTWEHDYSGTLLIVQGLRGICICVNTLRLRKKWPPFCGRHFQIYFVV